MRKNKVTIIGGGIAGMEAAGQMAFLGYNVTLLEKSTILGGHVNNWHHLFPDYKPASEIISKLKLAIHDTASIHFNAEVHKLNKSNNSYTITLTDGESIEADAIVVATGFDLFNATKKEEYGYKIYDNVITSADLEDKLKSGKPIKTSKGIIPKKIAFVHCVGSRDEKTGNTYCSKVCCVTAMKQAIEMKKANPDAEVYCFYMDLRMYDRYFEDIYFEAQTKHRINFIRGRLSESNEDQEGKLILRAEDTLTGRPLKITVDLLVLMTGMVSSDGTRSLAARFGLNTAEDKFLNTSDNHSGNNLTNLEGIFVAGTCTGPKSVVETLNDARSAALQAITYLKKLNGN
jgi:heterodisulfide reductase subunit A2